MQSGEVQANLCLLKESAKLSYLTELVHQKQTGAEKGVLGYTDMAVSIELRAKRER